MAIGHNRDRVRAGGDVAARDGCRMAAGGSEGRNKAERNDGGEAVELVKSRHVVVVLSTGATALGERTVEEMSEESLTVGGGVRGWAAVGEPGGQSAEATVHRYTYCLTVSAVTKRRRSS